MSRGPITRVAKTRKVDRRNSVLQAAWVHHLDAPPTSSPRDDLIIENGQPLPPAASADVVLLMANPGATAGFDHAAALGRAGARIYVLAEQGWTPSGTPLQSVRRILVRRLPEVPAGGLLLGPSATLWCRGENSKATAWRLALTPSQVAAFRQVFLRLFWHDAVDEAWAAGGQFEFRPAGERPFDVPEPTRESEIQLVPSDARLQPDQGHTHALFNHGLHVDMPLRRVWTRPSGEQNGLIRKADEAGCSVTWDDCGLPDATTDGRRGALLLPGKDARLRIELSPGQSAAALHVLDGPASWSFQAGLEIGAFADKPVEFWLPSSEGPAALSVDEQLDVPAVQPSELRDVVDAEPTDWPTPSPLALSATYSWEVVPPTVPGGAQDDPLVGQWRNVDRDWEKRLGVLRGALESLGGLRVSIGQTFKRLMRAVMGFERAESGLMAQLDGLDAERPSAVGPLGAPRLLDRLGRLEEEIGKLHVDLERAQQKAREEEERERQEAEWAESVAAARVELPDRKSELDTALEDEAGIAAQLVDVEATLAEETDKKAKKDLKARRHKLSDQGTRARQKARHLEQQIAAQERRIEEPFVYKPRPVPTTKKKGQGSRFVPATPKKVIKAIPDDALPAVGVLRKHKGKRYVVIDDWSELDRGETEASRLGASLVAREGT